MTFHDIIGQPLIVLGMHRSGTSFLASHLADLGVHLGENLLGPGIGNPHGHFEDKSIQQFHDELLVRSLSDYEKDALGAESVLSEYAVAPELNESDRQRARTLVAALQRPGVWGWKDPRTCLFADFWAQVLPSAKFVAIYRHPLEVFDSRTRRVLHAETLHPEMILNESRWIKACGAYNRAVTQILERGKHSFVAVNANEAFRNLGALDQALAERLEISGLARAKNDGAPASENKSDARAERHDFHSEEFHSLPITETVHRIFCAIYPEEGKVFDQLQQMAAIGYRFHQPAGEKEIAREKIAASLLDAISTQLPILANEDALPLLMQLAGDEDYPQKRAALIERVRRHTKVHFGWIHHLQNESKARLAKTDASKPTWEKRRVSEEELKTSLNEFAVRCDYLSDRIGSLKQKLGEERAKVSRLREQRNHILRNPLVKLARKCKLLKTELPRTTT